MRFSLELELCTNREAGPVRACVVDGSWEVGEEEGGEGGADDEDPDDHLDDPQEQHVVVRHSAPTEHPPQHLHHSLSLSLGATHMRLNRVTSVAQMMTDTLPQEVSLRPHHLQCYSQLSMPWRWFCLGYPRFSRTSRAQGSRDC